MYNGGGVLGSGLGAGGGVGAAAMAGHGSLGSMGELAHTGFSVVTPTLGGLALVIGGSLLRRTARVQAAGLGPLGGVHDLG